MNCELCTLDSSVDSLMWKCTGCTRAFHAACVGVTVQRNSARRNNNRKVVDMSSYLIPCCESCQEHLHAKLDFQQLIGQQKLLVEQINANTEVTHRITPHQESHRLVQEAIEGLEVLLVTIKNELATINKTSSLAGSVVAIKNHVTSLFDAAMTETKDSIATSLKTVTSELASDLRNISNDVCQLNQLSLDIATSCNMSTNCALEVDILDELKSLSANLSTIRYAAPLSTPSESYPSLEVELNRGNDASGWRLLGTRKIWKADWTEYDSRQTRRLAQQKQAEQAKKKKKTKARNKSRNNLHTNSPNHSNNNNNKSNNNNRNIFGNRDLNTHWNSMLPPDRVLLAAAKDRFSRPPSNYRPNLAQNRPALQFQRGDTLNPYPDNTPQSTQQINQMTSDCLPTIMCNACRSQHSCFQPYRRNP